MIYYPRRLFRLILDDDLKLRDMLGDMLPDILSDKRALRKSCALLIFVSYFLDRIDKKNILKDLVERGKDIFVQEVLKGFDNQIGWLDRNFDNDIYKSKRKQIEQREIKRLDNLSRRDRITSDTKCAQIVIQYYTVHYNVISSHDNRIPIFSLLFDEGYYVGDDLTQEQANTVHTLKIHVKSQSQTQNPPSQKIAVYLPETENYEESTRYVDFKDLYWGMFGYILAFAVKRMTSQQLKDYVLLKRVATKLYQEFKSQFDQQSSVKHNAWGINHVHGIAYVLTAGQAMFDVVGNDEPSSIINTTIREIQDEINLEHQQNISQAEDVKTQFQALPPDAQERIKKIISEDSSKNNIPELQKLLHQEQRIANKEKFKALPLDAQERIKKIMSEDSSKNSVLELQKLIRQEQQIITKQQQKIKFELELKQQEEIRQKRIDEKKTQVIKERVKELQKLLEKAEDKDLTNYYIQKIQELIEQIAHKIRFWDLANRRNQNAKPDIDINTNIDQNLGINSGINTDPNIQDLNDLLNPNLDLNTNPNIYQDLNINHDANAANAGTKFFGLLYQEQEQNKNNAHKIQTQSQQTQDQKISQNIKTYIDDKTVKSTKTVEIAHTKYLTKEEVERLITKIKNFNDIKPTYANAQQLRTNLMKQIFEKLEKDAEEAEDIIKIRTLEIIKDNLNSFIDILFLKAYLSSGRIIKDIVGLYILSLAYVHFINWFIGHGENITLNIIPKESISIYLHISDFLDHGNHESQVQFQIVVHDAVQAVYKKIKLIKTNNNTINNNPVNREPYVVVSLDDLTFLVPDNFASLFDIDNIKHIILQSQSKTTPEKVISVTNLLIKSIIKDGGKIIQQTQKQKQEQEISMKEHSTNNTHKKIEQTEDNKPNPQANNVNNVNNVDNEEDSDKSSDEDIMALIDQLKNHRYHHVYDRREKHDRYEKKHNHQYDKQKRTVDEEIKNDEADNNKTSKTSNRTMYHSFDSKNNAINEQIILSFKNDIIPTTRKENIVKEVNIAQEVREANSTGKFLLMAQQQKDKDKNIVYSNSGMNKEHCEDPFSSNPPSNQFKETKEAEGWRLEMLKSIKKKHNADDNDDNNNKEQAKNNIGDHASSENDHDGYAANSGGIQKELHAHHHGKHHDGQTHKACSNCDIF